MRGVLVPLALAALAAAPGPAAAPQATPSPGELARRLQAHYDTVRDFSADFTHSYTGGIMKAPDQHGTLLVKKPGRMRWTYGPPSRQQIVSDNSQIYTYIPKDAVVYVSRMPAAGDAEEAALFLTGRGSLVDDFTPAMTPPQPDRAWRLTLTPKRPQVDFTTLTLVVARDTLELRGMDTVDDQGGTSTFLFTNLRENRGLPDSRFVFDLSTLPHNVQVIRR
jgi:outer membrane lipoprotein carrier protein